MGLLTLLVLSLSAAPSSAAHPAFPAIEGWTLSAPAKYGPDNLYEYINGAADAFLQQDVEELTSVEYSNAEKVVVTVDVYRHRDPFRAYAMYSQERPNDPKLVPVGIEGYAGEDHLEFVAGPWYVKLAQAGGRGQKLLQPIAEKVAAGLPGTRNAPPVLEAFPEKGKKPRSEKLTAKEFLGHAFLHDGAAAAYEIDGARFRLFAIQGRDATDARAMLARYLSLAKSDLAPKPEGSATLKDPLNGEVQLSWKGRWIWGAVDQPSKSRAALVEELGKKLLISERARPRDGM